ncbi:MAG: hypothetical protein ACKPJD_33915, partial [Planctomycetaceae bacterium]
RPGRLVSPQRHAGTAQNNRQEHLFSKHLIRSSHSEGVAAKNIEIPVISEQRMSAEPRLFNEF